MDFSVFSVQIWNSHPRSFAYSFAFPLVHVLHICHCFTNVSFRLVGVLGKFCFFFWFYFNQYCFTVLECNFKSTKYLCIRLSTSQKYGTTVSSEDQCFTLGFLSHQEKTFFFPVRSVSHLLSRVTLVLL